MAVQAVPTKGNLMTKSHLHLQKTAMNFSTKKEIYLSER